MRPYNNNNNNDNNIGGARTSMAGSTVTGAPRPWPKSLIDDASVNCLHNHNDNDNNNNVGDVPAGPIQSIDRSMASVHCLHNNNNNNNNIGV